MFALVRWFEERPATWRDVGVLVLAAFGIKVAWTLLAGTGLHYFDYFTVSAMESPGSDVAESGADRLEVDTGALVLLGGVFLAGMALLEEVIFRLVPLFLALLLFRWWYVTKPFVLIVALGASAAFGLIHIFEHAGSATLERALVITTLFQGVGGIIYSVVFLKYAGMKLRYTIPALLVTSAMHLSWNAGVLGVAYVFG